MAEVFISYSRRDGAFVHELHGFLTGAGRDVWVDWEDIPAASKWQQDIHDSIDAADSLVFVISPSSLESEYCATELEHAQERGKRIVPIAIDGARPDDAPPALRELNWIWCRDGDNRDAAFAALGNALDTDLEWAKAHTRLLVRAVEWDARKDGSLLLRGKDLAEVESVLAANAGKEPRPTELQERYVHASRRGAKRRQRSLLSGVTIALAISIVLGLLALLQRNDARSATRKATSAALAAAANDRVDSRPDQALLLALAAYASSPSADARNAGVTALERARKLGVTEFVHGDSQVNEIAIAPNGRTLAVGSADGAVRLWDLSARKEAATLAQPGTTLIRSVGFTKDGSTVAAASDDGTVRLWDVDSGDLAAPVLRAGRALRTSEVSPDGRWVAAINGIGRVVLLEVGGDTVRPLALPSGYQADWLLAFSPDSRKLAAAVNNGEEGGVRVWDVASGNRIGDATVPVPEALAFAPDGRTLVTGSTPDDDFRHGELRFWSVPRLTERGRLESQRRFSRVAFAQAGRSVVAHRYDGSIQRAKRVAGSWKWIGSPRRVLPADLASVAGFSLNAQTAFSRDARTIAVAPTNAAAVRVWTRDGRAPFGRVIGRYRGGAFAGLGGGIAFSPPDGRNVAAVDGNEILVAPTGSATAESTWLKGPPMSIFDRVAFAADESTLAGRYDGGVRVWNLPSGERLTSGEAAAAGAFEFDLAGRMLAEGGARVGVTNVSLATAAANGHTLAIGDYDGNVWLWDSRSDEPAKRLALDPMGERDGSVSGLALTPDGSTLAVSDSSYVWLWDVRSQKPLGRRFARGTGGDSSGLAFSPDGRVLATADGYVLRLWEGVLWRDLADLRTQVCSLVAGDLTRDEWASIAPALPYRSVC